MMKQNLKKMGFVIVGVLLLVGLYIGFLNLTSPIKGTYVYNNDESITLQFKNGMYIFKGKGYAYDNIVKTYGNYVRFSLEEIKQDQTYTPVTKTKLYHLTLKNNNDIVFVTVKDDGTLSLIYSVMDSSYLEFHKLGK